MKQITSSAKKMLCIALMSTLVACSGSDPKASDKAISVGKQAIVTVDDYLDGNITYDEADNKLSELYDDMSYVSDMDEDDEHKAYDSSIEVDLLTISHNVTMDHFQGSNETYDDIMESRNELAEKIGEKDR